MGQAKAKQNTQAKSLFASLLNRLASVKFAVALVVVIVVCCVIGTIVPQGADAGRYLARHPKSAARFDSLEKLGFTHVFSSGWFIGLICGLAASVAVCSARRLGTVRRTTGFSRGRAFGSMFTHISFLLILMGAVIRGVWGQKGYVEFHEGQTVAQFVTGQGPQPLPFSIHLSSFEIETYNQKSAPSLAGSALLVTRPEKNLEAAFPIKLGVEQSFDEFKITILKYVPDFVVDTQTHEVASRSDQPRNPAILVAVAGPTYSNHRWLFAKFPGFVMHTPDSKATDPSPLQMVYRDDAMRGKALPNAPIKSFKSTLQILNGNTVVKSKTIEVNDPISYKGYTLYQSGYDPNDLTYTSLQVVKDPGVVVVYAGFWLMIAGLFIVFYLNPWLNQQRASKCAVPKDSGTPAPKHANTRQPECLHT
ncbi:MAG TPA: cytochrome c biogenesis protein ResB [Verrucomicrobiae bacterium]|nr:cytochrome c biogenesis protein ResB [Verrucomicrobiae bacterium]